MLFVVHWFFASPWPPLLIEYGRATRSKWKGYGIRLLDGDTLLSSYSVEINELMI